MEVIAPGLPPIHAATFSLPHEVCRTTAEDPSRVSRLDAQLAEERRSNPLDRHSVPKTQQSILMKKHHLWIFIIRKLVALTFVLTFFIGVRDLEAQIVHKKEAFPQLSSDQFHRIGALYPDPNKPAFVSLKLQVAKGDVIKVDLVTSCGVPDVDQFVLKWVWNTYHYDKAFSGETTIKVRVNSPFIRNPQPRLSWRAWQEVYKADPLKEGKRFISKFNIVVRQGRIVDVELVTSSGLPQVDQEFRDQIRTKWVAAPGATANIPASMTAHRGYY
jgi:hypothetical protein